APGAVSASSDRFARRSASTYRGHERAALRLREKRPPEFHDAVQLRIARQKRFRILALDRLSELTLDHGSVRNRLRRTMIVRVKVEFLHDPPGGVGRVREFFQLRC